MLSAGRASSSTSSSPCCLPHIVDTLTSKIAPLPLPSSLISEGNKWEDQGCQIAMPPSYSGPRAAVLSSFRLYFQKAMVQQSDCGSTCLVAMPSSTLVDLLHQPRKRRVPLGVNYCLAMRQAAVPSTTTTGASVCVESFG
jgi:hypothetical protein